MTDAPAAPPLPTLSAAAAAALDQELLALFPLASLMELAGLAVAQAVHDAHSPCRVLVVAGPGNNGGDALVAARHLRAFGFAPTVVVPSLARPARGGEGAALLPQLVAQLRALDVPVLAELAELPCPALAAAAALELQRAAADEPPPPPLLASALPFDVALDGVFGFSFRADARGGVRPPYDALLAALRVAAAAGVPVVSIDVPSGWDVDLGDVAPRSRGGGLQPAMVVSLTAPKPCVARCFAGRHYLGGRFVPPQLAARYGLGGDSCADSAAEGRLPQLPAFPGSAQVVRLR